MVPEGTQGRFDPGFIAGIGIVLIDLNDQVGFAVQIHQLLEILDDEGIGSAFKGSDQHRIQVFGPADQFSSPQDI